MTKTDFSKTEACVFDAYGTLFDVDAAARQEKERLGDNWKALSDTWRLKQLQYTWLLSLQGNYRPFWEVTESALEFALQTQNIDDASLKDRLMDIYMRLSAYEEVPTVLKSLKEAGKKCAILSNGDMKMLEAATENAGIGDYLDAIISVEELQIYKPHGSVYKLAEDKLGIKGSLISFQSSNGWDAYSAKDYGFNVIWCNRFGQPDEQIPSPPDHQISNLKEMLPIIGT